MQMYQGLYISQEKLRFSMVTKTPNSSRLTTSRVYFFAHAVCLFHVGCVSVPVISHQDPEGVMENHTLAFEATSWM